MYFLWETNHNRESTSVRYTLVSLKNHVYVLIYSFNSVFGCFALLSLHEHMSNMMKSGNEISF